jgi:hypothetical protein
VEEVVERVDVNEAQASVEADLVRIRAQINESVGTDGFHAALQQKLMAALSLTVLHAPSKGGGGVRKRPTQVTTKRKSRRGRVQPHPLLVRSAREEEEGQHKQHKQQQKDSAGEVQMVTCNGIDGTGRASPSDRTPHKTSVTGELELCV